MYDKQWLQVNREELRDGKFAKDWKQKTEEGRMVMKERCAVIQNTSAMESCINAMHQLLSNDHDEAGPWKS
eukprot:83316-Pelagomonas_calceolata.AAC.10